MANTPGCGLHYLPRQYSTFPCISGRRVTGRSMKSTSLTGGTPIRGLNTHRGEQHWECFCKLPGLLSSREFRSQISFKLPCHIFPRRPSYHHSTVGALLSPPCTVGGYIFRYLNIPPLWCCQCPPIPDHQT